MSHTPEDEFEDKELEPFDEEDDPGDEFDEDEEDEEEDEEEDTQDIDGGNVRPRVQLTGTCGNAFMVIGLCVRAMRRAGWPEGRIVGVRDEMMKGDYDHLLQVAMKHFDVR